jgi:predicted alpha/beta hydrolase family esterase
MTRIIIVHRWSGGPEDDWRPWLKEELQALGHEVIVPAMPDTETPVIEKWVRHLTKIVGKPDTDTYFVGHSIGCQAILRYLETLNEPVGGAIFVAGWFDLENLEDGDTRKIAEPWIKTAIDLKKVRGVLPKSTLFISNNDPYGAYDFNIEKFKELGSEIIIQNKAGHMTTDDGFIQHPGILEELKEMIG